MVVTTNLLINRITPEKAETMLDFLAETDTPGENMPGEMFLWKEGERWVAMDNRGDRWAWIEEFKEEYQAIHWLLGW
jgi:hypothetical protein